MKTKDLNKKNIEDLNSKLLNLTREQLDLRVQAASGQLRKTHLFKKKRREIARIKTLLTQLGYMI